MSAQHRVWKDTHPTAIQWNDLQTAWNEFHLKTKEGFRFQMISEALIINKLVPEVWLFLCQFFQHSRCQ
jgi:hypothetical protein